MGRLSDLSAITGARLQDRELGGKVHTLYLLSTALAQWISYGIADRRIPPRVSGTGRAQRREGGNVGKGHVKKQGKKAVPHRLADRLGSTAFR